MGLPIELANVRKHQLRTKRFIALRSFSWKLCGSDSYVSATNMCQSAGKM
jgi:hypothetical protein